MGTADARRTKASSRRGRAKAVPATLVVATTAAAPVVIGAAEMVVVVECHFAFVVHVCVIRFGCAVARACGYCLSLHGQRVRPKPGGKWARPRVHFVVQRCRHVRRVG